MIVYGPEARRIFNIAHDASGERPPSGTLPKGKTMSIAGRKLEAGDEALTDFNGRGLTLVMIVQRIEGTRSQSGICRNPYRLSC